MRTISTVIRYILILLIGLLVAEIGARIVVDHLLKRSPEFCLDPVLGWKAKRLSNITDAKNGNSANTMLIIGDSYCYGEGIQIKSRFDHRMAEMGYTKKIVNLGVSGYSTDQEFLAGESMIRALGNGSVVMLETFGDDFRGLLSSFFAGRPKPYFRQDGGEDVLVPAKIRMQDVLKDRSYLVRALNKWVFPDKAVAQPLNFQDLDTATGIYHRLILKHLVPAAERGAKVVIVYHGHKVVDHDFGDNAGMQVEYEIRRLCEQFGFTYLYLDPEMDKTEFKQPDGVHWNALGHEKFAELMMRACDNPNYQIHLSQKENR